jgi:tetratricopeptide (TPR) repeat protein
VACLERVLVQQPAAGEVRRVLGDLYRGSSSWEPLAQLLTDATAYLSDAEELAVAAREAHRLFRDEVKSPARALPALERAAAARPDAELALALCEAFVAAGRLDEARTQLQRMLKGARRASERAALHHQLGRVARAQGDMAASIAELEQAAAVDRSDPKLLRLLGDTARDAGQADRAERAYRGLLMLLRRSGAGAGQAGVSTVETLLALQELASERGEADKAAELLDSAFEVAAHDRDELGRLRERLDRRGDLAPLAKALERRAAASRGPAEQADVYRELAEIRARMGDRAGALEAELAALQATPEDATLRVRARDRARAAGLVDRYVSALEAIADRRRRRDDGALVASLLLLAGEAIESDLGDAPRALAVFQRAADTSELRAEAASALARVGAACNPAVRARALDRLARLGREAPSPEAQADALFRLAEARLGQPDTRAAGMEALGAALERVPALDRALALVRDAAVPSEELRQVLPLYERLARASGDNRMLLDCLERRAAEADAGVDVVREGYELAVALREDDRAEALLGRLIGVGRGRSGANGAVPGAAWGLTERSRRLRARGELAGAERALVEALEVGDAAVVLPLLRDLAAEAMGTGGDVAVAVRVYETLRARMPGDDRIWETLFDLYARTDDRPALARLVQGALEQLVSPAARNGVRMRYVRYLLDRDPADHTAVDVLRDVLLDEGDHDEAAARLTEVYERQGEEGLLVELLDHRRQRLVERADAAGARAAAVKVAQLLAAEQADRAVEVLAEALAQQPGESSLVEALLALLPTDAADPRLQRIDEVLGAQPDQSAMRAAREAGYRTAELWEPLADLLVEQAEHESVTQEAAANLREAASIHTTRLFDLPTAVELLRRARELDPYDVDLVRELVGLLVDLGETRRAQAEAFAASRSPNLPRDVRARLLALRAELLSASGQRDAAIAVLLEATGYAGPELKKELFAMVERLRSGPAAAEAKADPGVEDVTDLVEITDQ